VILIARTFGATDVVDAFLIAFVLPAFFADVVAGPLGAALIPALIETREREGASSAHKLHSSLTAGMIGVMCLIALALALLVPVIVPLLGSGFSPEKLQLTKGAFYWLLPLLPMGALGVSWRSGLNAAERFAIPAMAAGTTPLMLAILLVTIGAQWGIAVLICGTLAGNIVELALLAAGLRESGIPILPRWSGADPVVRRVFRQQFPLIATAALGQAGVLIDQSVAASLGAGSVAALNYGTRLTTVIAGIGVSALGTAALPHLSRMVIASRWREVRSTLLTYGSLIFLGALSLSVMLVVYSEQLVNLVFRGGALTQNSAELVAAVQRMAMLQLPALALLGLLGRFVTSLRRNEMLALAAALNLIVNVAGDFILPRFIGLPGIALSSVLAQLVSLSCVLVYVVNRLRHEGV
jgi:putative peptidoglycan lipid II flippase